MPHEALTLSSDTVNSLFPFHILVSEDGESILSMGQALSGVLPRESFDRTFSQLFEVSRPRIDDLSVAIVKSHLRSSIILKARGTDLVLRGQVLLSSETTVLFIGSVLVKGADSLQNHGISLQQFQPFDLTPDMVILHKFRELENRDHMKNARELLEMSKSHDELSEYAYTDELTKIANRRGFWHAGEKILQDHKSFDSSQVVLALLDLDDFKGINDQFGHDAGDAVICETADRLTNVVGQRGLVARLGGDEFVVILILDAHQDRHERAQQVLNAVNGNYKHGHQQLSIVASMGVTQVDATDSIETAIHNADVAMYRGRVKKYGEVAWFTSEIAASIKNKKQMQVLLEVAINAGLIEPHFQPIVELAGTGLVGFEALARWHDADLGMVRPDIFIALAEEIGMLAQLDRLILKKSLDQVSEWHKQGKFYSVHVNVSAASIGLSLIDHVVTELNSRDINPTYLTLELTETTIIENTDLTREVIEKLADHGICFQLDDFGTGYSSLTHLHDLPVTGIKIDRSFVADAHIEEKSRSLLKSVVNIAHELQLEIVAEGIENQEQMNFLIDIGCKYAQGFYIGKPAPANYCEVLFPQLARRVA